MKKLSEMFPKELRMVRLGTCYNNLDNKLILNTRAFNLENIPPNKLIFDPGLGSLDFISNSSSSINAFEGYFGASIKGEMGFSCCKASAELNMSLATANQDDNQKICSYLTYTIKGASISVMQSIPELQFSWMSEEFKYLYTKLVEAPDSQKLKYYNTFTKTFGHGVVTHIDLASGAYGKFEITSNETANSLELKFGASMAVGTPKGGVSGAIEAGAKFQNALKNASLEIHTDWYPSTSPAKKWAMDLYSLGKEQGMSILSQKTNLKDLPVPDKVTAPEFPVFVKPKEKKLPEPNPDVKDESYLNNKSELSKEDFKALISEENLSTEQIVKESNQISKDNLDLKKTTQSSPLLKSTRPITNIEFTDEIEMATSTGANSFTNELGDYIPSNFKLTPWTDLFPDLKIQLKPTKNSLLISKVNIFYYTRLQFGQYLQFLSTLPYENTKQSSLEMEVIEYFKICEQFMDYASNNLNGLKFQESQYAKTIKYFNKLLNKLINSKKFSNKEIYDRFFEHYSTFQEFAYGVIPYFKYYKFNGGNTCYPKSSDEAPKTSWYCNMPLIGCKKKDKEIYPEAIRFYPVLTKDGKCHFVYYDNGWKTEIEVRDNETLTGDNWNPGIPSIIHRFKWDSITDMISSLKGEEITAKSFYANGQGYNHDTGYSYNNMKPAQVTISYQKVGFNNIPEDGSFIVRGSSMFNNFPFNTALSMVNSWLQ